MEDLIFQVQLRVAEYIDTRHFKLHHSLVTILLLHISLGHPQGKSQPCIAGTVNRLTSETDAIFIFKLDA